MSCRREMIDHLADWGRCRTGPRPHRPRSLRRRLVVTKSRRSRRRLSRRRLRCQKRQTSRWHPHRQDLKIGATSRCRRRLRVEILSQKAICPLLRPLHRRDWSNCYRWETRNRWTRHRQRHCRPQGLTMMETRTHCLRHRPHRQRRWASCFHQHLRAGTRSRERRRHRRHPRQRDWSSCCHPENPTMG